VNVNNVVVMNVMNVDVVADNIMNQQDRKEFEIVHLKIDDMRSDIVELRKEMDDAHKRTEESLSFIKENLFNPHQGLWSETKLNTQYREDSKKWRYPIGVGFISLIIKNIWDTMTS
jgi:hypothetical protein